MFTWMSLIGERFSREFSFLIAADNSLRDADDKSGETLQVQVKIRSSSEKKANERIQFPFQYPIVSQANEFYLSNDDPALTKSPSVIRLATTRWARDSRIASSASSNATNCSRSSSKLERVSVVETSVVERSEQVNFT